MDKTPYNPTVLLRCSKCHDKTPHLLINFSNDPALAITMVYECQDCGEIKKAFDLDTLPQVTFEPAKTITIEEKQRLVPIEKGPQIEQSA
jgi:uncharacterized Zn finger protein